ncbi:hypothetical protein CEXT_661391 [Caerostris extrusa]|uniref:Uncharacterized protein n=1 Tax=Caerostris extrusa TaxID=172846 RepID=A0AAV4XI46_CAEEX|nr:hypothetical protein CEXT_661391 [Caerostris extrusa]
MPLLHNNHTDTLLPSPLSPEWNLTLVVVLLSKNGSLNMQLQNRLPMHIHHTSPPERELNPARDSSIQKGDESSGRSTTQVQKKKGIANFRGAASGRKDWGNIRIWRLDPEDTAR